MRLKGVACQFYMLFAPQMSECWSNYDKSEPEFLLWITFLCIPLIVCQSKIIASESSSNLIHPTCIMFLYLYRIYIYILLKFLLTCFNWIHPSVWQLWLLVLLPIVRSQRQIIFKRTLVCTYSLVLGLSSPCFYSLVHTRLWWTEHSGLKYTCGECLLHST